MKEVKFDIKPIPKPRMTQSDRWRGRSVVERYYIYKDGLNILANEIKFSLPRNFKIDFYLSMPKSWSKKKRSEFLGKPHHQKPDLDNLIKAFMDALEQEDKDVWHIDASKYWSDSNYMIIKWDGD
jgi:Holliday junction resolvase RusA-like endonuclease